ncbi:MAG: hypothetical protein LBC64_02965 [Fibromonadaceae bacterium]|jgi:uncharacterized protein (TIGR02145 family)|nr:hypothetical protein [Fibromonadaceae bacterium]
MSNIKFTSLLFLGVALFLSCTDIPDDLRNETGGEISSSSRRSSSSFNNDACKNIVFNASTNFCYDGIVYSKCNGMGYNPSTHICDGSAAYPAICNGKEYNPLEQRCQDDILESKCGESWYDASNSKFECSRDDVVRFTECGDVWEYDASTYFCHTDNTVHYKCNGNNYNVSTQYCSNGTLKNYGSVTYERKTYKTVIIGYQTWMAENLNYNVGGSRCYNDEESICAIFGRLYDWATAMNLLDSCNRSSCASQVGTKHRGICPSGWHLPSYDEWQILVDFVGGEEIAGRKLKTYDRYYCWDYAEDTFGFSALLGGFGSYRGFSGVQPVSGGGYSGDYGSWWSSSYDDYLWGNDYCYYAYSIHMQSTRDHIDIESINHDRDGLYSVRCVKDN